MITPETPNNDQRTLLLVKIKKLLEKARLHHEKTEAMKLKQIQDERNKESLSECTPDE